MKDPRLAASVSDADLVLQHELAREIQAERLRVAGAQAEATALRTQIAARRRAAGAPSAELDAFTQAIDRAAGPPIRSRSEEFLDEAEMAPTSLRKLGTSLAGLQSAVESADAAPTPDARAGLDARRRMVAEGLERWGEVLTLEKPKLDEALRGAGLEPLKAGEK